MKTANAGLIVLVVAAVAIVLVVQHQTQSQLRMDDQSLRQQIAQLRLDNQSLSNRLAAAGRVKPLSGEENDELLRLRSEVGILRQQTNETGTLREKLNALKRNLQSPSGNTPSEEQQREMAMHKMDDAKQAGLLLHMFADDNNNEFPTNFDQVARYLGNSNFIQVFSNEFDIVYSGSLNEIPAPSSAIVVQEHQAWQTYDGKWAKVYGFADGHSQLITAPDGDFTGFEQQHAARPTQNQ